MNLAFFESIHYSIARHPMFTALLGVLCICILLWFIGGSRARVIALVLIVLGVCVSSFKWGLSLGKPDQWNVLISVATLLAVSTALFADALQKLVYRVRFTVDLESNFIDLNGVLWVRGKITNSGDRAIDRCRLKLLRVEEQPTAVENGFLQWQGGIREPLTISSQEHLIFDIGTRRAAQGSPLTLLAYIGPNELAQDLVARRNYRVTMAVYGDNIRTRMKTVAITVGSAADEIELS